ncbi:hypothetical protein PG997_015370 [Apiospora hydei]|uniref:Uncharacterized protein n=1 Tax=Apiospora hydei TaxID=1337664 RepID=A0ABR1UQF1_9PEZI
MAGLLGAAVIKTAQNALRLYHFWNDLTGLGKLWTFFGGERAINSIEDGAYRIQSGFSRWFSSTAKQTAQLVEEEVVQFTSLVLGIVTIVLIAMDMDTKKDGLLQAMDIIMLISSSLQVLAVVAGWVLAAATAAGADFRDPITKFVEDKARPDGLYIENPMQAPDYITTVPPDEQTPSLPGLTFKGPLLPATTVHGLDSKIAPAFLRLGDGNGHVELVDKVDFTANTIWSMETDPWGKSLIYTRRMTKDATTGYVAYTLWYLGTDQDKNVIVRTMPKPSSNDAWKSAVATIQWQVDLQEPPKTKTENNKTSILSVKARIQKDGLDLGRIVHIDGKPAEKLALVDLEQYRKKADNYKRIAAMGYGALKQLREGLEDVPYFLWELNMQAIGPGAFAYDRKAWELTDQTTNDRIRPRFENDPSSGLKWSISPALDAADFELVTQGTDAGTVKQKEGVKPKVTSEPPIEYTVTCTLNKDGEDKVSHISTFTLSVVAQPS